MKQKSAARSGKAPKAAPADATRAAASPAPQTGAASQPSPASKSSPVSKSGPASKSGPVSKSRATSRSRAVRKPAEAGGFSGIEAAAPAAARTASRRSTQKIAVTLPDAATQPDTPPLPITAPDTGSASPAPSKAGRASSGRASATSEPTKAQLSAAHSATKGKSTRPATAQASGPRAAKRAVAKTPPSEVAPVPTPSPTSEAPATRTAAAEPSPTKVEAAPAKPQAQVARPEVQAAKAEAPTAKPEAPAAKPEAQPARPEGVAGSAGSAGSGPREGTAFDDSSMLRYMVKNPEAFAHNIARMVEGAGKAAAAYLRPRENGHNRGEMAEELTTVFKTLANVGEYWLSDPARALDAQTRLWTGYMDVWSRSLKRMAGEPTEPAVRPDPRDKRFQDPDWNENQFFDFLKQMYLVTTRWADHIVDKAEGLDPHTRQKAEFYVKQIANAIAPTNFLLTNPELLRETVASNGENLVRGIQMMAEDIEAGGGDLKIRQSNPGKFKVGENLATTPGKVIWQNDVCQILQYEPATEQVYKRPLLIVPPWINKFYILDLNPEKSFIRWAVGEGRTVFVISWVNPDARQAQKSFEHYMREGILTALDVIEHATGERQADTIGYCVGGTLLGVTLAYCAATGDDRIRSATFFTTQVDFTHAGDLKVFVDEEQIKVLEARMKERGYLEGKKMASSFNMLRSNDLIWPYFINNYMRGKEPFPFDLLYWNSDSTRMPAANHSYYMRNCYLENKLTKGEMEIGGIKLDLGKVSVPVYNLAAREDHIAPARSVFVGCQFFGGPVTYVMAGSGHIAGVINPPAKAKYQYWTGGKPVGNFEDWIASATEHPGSWWPHWQQWVSALAPETVPARVPGGGKLTILEEAPGSFVKAKS